MNVRDYYIINPKKSQGLFVISDGKPLPQGSRLRHADFTSFIGTECESRRGFYLPISAIRTITFILLTENGSSAELRPFGKNIRVVEKERARDSS